MIRVLSYFPLIISDNPDLWGLNVTIPYKEKVIPFLDELSLEAQNIGAVIQFKLFVTKVKLN